MTSNGTTISRHPDDDDHQPHGSKLEPEPGPPTPASPPLLTPPVTGTRETPISLLLINPNSTHSMTQACLTSLTPHLPTHCTVTGFTAPPPAPSAIESHSDAVLSSATCLRALKPILPSYDGFLVACYSKHPLIDALREEVVADADTDGDGHQRRPPKPPVIGIMEASMYASRMLGGRFGIVATSARSAWTQEEAVRGAYGLGPWHVGSEATRLGVLELASGSGSSSRERERERERDKRVVVLERVREATRRLVVEKGADCICLGCAGMTDMKGAVGEALEGMNMMNMMMKSSKSKSNGGSVAIGGGGGLGSGVNVIDGVVVGVLFLVALCSGELGTANRGIYWDAEERRRMRGQDWF